MKFEKDFEKLVNKQIQYEEDNDVDYYDGSLSEFSKLFQNGLLKSPFKNKNAKYLLQHLDVVLKYTNQSNLDWISYSIMYNQEYFLDTFAHNLKFFRFPDYISELINLLYASIDEESLITKDYLFSYKMLDAITDLNISNSQVYQNLFLKMSNDQIKIFLSLALKKKLNIDFYNITALNDENYKFIEDNVVDFATNCKDVLSLKNVVKNNKEALEQLNQYIDMNPDIMIDSMLTKISRYGIKKDRKQLKEFLGLLVQDICKNENVNISSLEYVTSGSFSHVFRIKDKILKIGKPRGMSTFPNNPYIMKPLLRKTMTLDEDKLFIEITEKAEIREVDNDDLYNLYKELRNLGLIWTDVAPRNVAYLIKDNETYWDEELGNSNEAIELLEERGNKSLKEGELVIIDSDFIFDESDPNIKYINNNLLQKEFEERYQKEKNNKLNDMLNDKENNMSEGTNNKYK